MTYTIRPISDPTRFHGGYGEPHRFQADLNDTKKLLEYEVGRLDGHDLVVELDVQPGDIAATGQSLKGYARPNMPGVVVAFQSKHGPLVYATDRFDDWRANLRAIAKSLEALRAVDRYGVSSRGEQYTGWAQIEAGPSKQAAAELLERIAIGDEGGQRERSIGLILTDPAIAKNVLKHARAMVHPDRNAGDRTAWDQVEEAAQILGVVS